MIAKVIPWREDDVVFLFYKPIKNEELQEAQCELVPPRHPKGITALFFSYAQGRLATLRNEEPLSRLASTVFERTIAPFPSRSSAQGLPVYSRAPSSRESPKPWPLVRLPRVLER